MFGMLGMQGRWCIIAMHGGEGLRHDGPPPLQAPQQDLQAPAAPGPPRGGRWWGILAGGLLGPVVGRWGILDGLLSSGGRFGVSFRWGGVGY